MTNVADAPSPGPRVDWRAALRALRVMFLGGDGPAASDGTLSFLRTNRVIARGLSVVVVFVVIVMGWAALAPLDSALMTSGVVIVESHRKAIQHLEDGIVQEILVRDGQAGSRMQNPNESPRR